MIHYIIKALQQAESIYVNDLGTFSLHYKSARIEGEKLLPPRNVVTLDTATDQDDLSFTRLICQEKQCMLTEANREITQWVEELKNALANNKSVSFEEFGTFSQDSKGRLTFEAMDVPDLNIEFEGMPELSLNVSDIPTEIEEDKEEVENEKEEVTDNIIPEKESENEEITEVITTVEETEKEEVTDNIIPEKESENEEITEVITSEKESENEEITEVITTVEETEKEEGEPVDTEEVKTEEETEKVETTEEITSEKGSENEEITEQITTEEESGNEDNVKGEEIEVEEDDEKDEKDEEDEDKPKKRRSLWWLYTLIVLLLLAALGYIFRNKIQDILRPVFDRFAHKEVEATKPEEIDTDTVSFTEVDTTAVAETAVVEEPYEPEVIKTSSAGYPYIHFEQGHYYAIAGSFLTEKEVLSHIRAKHLDEYSPKLVLQDGVSNIRICIGIYDTEEEAETFAKSINPKYWVLK